MCEKSKHRKLLCFSFLFWDASTEFLFNLIWCNWMHTGLGFFVRCLPLSLCICLPPQVQRAISGKVKAYLCWRRHSRYYSKAVGLLLLPCKEQCCSHQPCLGRCWHHLSLFLPLRIKRSLPWGHLVALRASNVIVLWGFYLHGFVIPTIGPVFVVASPM